MHLPPLQSPISASYHTSGDVAIATDAVIAPGVVLMADPSARIVIGAGACLGLGVVLHASQGTIVVEAGASLGAGVLAVGNCRVGTQACVGASTTLYNASVPPSQLVPPCSLLGEVGRSSVSPSASFSGQAAASDPQAQAQQNGFHSGSEEPSPWDDPVDRSGAQSPSTSPSSDGPSRMGEEDVSATTDSPSNTGSATSTNEGLREEVVVPKPQRPKKPEKVYGKEQFERMRTLFLPHQNL